jgi:hypothetical protein
MSVDAVSEDNEILVFLVINGLKVVKRVKFV